MNSKNISVRLRPENVDDFYLLKEFLSNKDPLLTDINNNQLVNYCINLAIDYHSEQIESLKKKKRNVHNEDKQ